MGLLASWLFKGIESSLVGFFSKNKEPMCYYLISSPYIISNRFPYFPLGVKKGLLEQNKIKKKKKRPM